MSLDAGTRLGPYEVVSSLGAGGMGEVYRARDTKLGREVALKILPAAFLGDSDRMVRFQREAQVLASLNHPHIAAIYGLEESEGVRALAMELVEGATLADRIAAGPIPVDEVAEICRQIADALEYAHDKGVVHRDLKPANVKITPEGQVKVLDFGLAKAAESSPATSDPSNSPTMTLGATQAGVIMGTAAYMSPEQASGRPVDKRADIWSFGVVLWEMLSSRRLFGGETVSHTLADVLRAEIDTNQLPAATPPSIRDLAGRCLDRDVKSRLRDIGEARILLQRYLAHPAASPPRIDIAAAAPVASRLPWMVSAALLAALSLLGLAHFRERPPEAVPVQFEVPPPPMMNFQWFDLPVISPDGRTLAFTGTIGAGPAQNVIVIRPMNSLEVRVLAGTDGAIIPFWSPDSRSLAFFTQGKLSRIDLARGPSVTICELRSYSGGTWNQDGTILIGGGAGPLLRVAASGGEPQPALSLDSSRSETGQSWPFFLPDGRHFLYLSRSSDPAKSGVYVAALDSKVTELLVTGENMTAYAAGNLLYPRQQTLFAQPFDPNKRRLAGDPFPVAEGIGRMTLGAVGGALFSVSSNGVLAYRGGNNPDTRLNWYSRDGKRLAAVGESGAYRQVVLSPDESRIAIERTDPKTATWDIWLLELKSGIFSRFTANPANEADPLWSADGRSLIYNSDRTGKLDLYRKALGSEQEDLILADADRKVAESVLKNGTIVYSNLRGQTIFGLAPGGRPEVLMKNEFVKDEMRISPDERWIAYGSLESGRWEVYVASYPGFTGRRQVSNAGGAQATWRKDSKEVYYLSLDGKVMAVDVTAGKEIDTGTPRVLFDTRVRVSPVYDQYAISADGSRFLMLEPVEEGAKPITVVLNGIPAPAGRIK